MKIRRLFLMVLAVLLGGLLVACSSEETAKNDEANILKVGMECGYPPYNWTQQDDSKGAVPIQGTNTFAGGYDVELAKKVAESLGKDLVVVKTEWTGLPPAVQSDKIDLIMAGMSPTAERKEQIDFTQAYWVSDYVIIVKKASAYENASSLEDFANAKITGQLNTVHYDIIEQIQGVAKQDPMEDFPQMRVALQSGIIDGYIAEMPEGKSVEAATDDLVMVKFDKDKGFIVEDNINSIAAGIKKGNDELKGKVDEVFSSVTEEERQEIMENAIKNQPATN